MSTVVIGVGNAYRCDDGVGGQDTAPSQYERHSGIVGPALPPPHLADDLPIACDVADKKPQGGVLEPLLAVGRGRGDAPGEVGGGPVPPAA